MSLPVNTCPIGDGAIDPNTGVVSKPKHDLNEMYKGFYQRGLQMRAEAYMKACDHGTMAEMQWLNDLAQRTENVTKTPTHGYDAPVDGVNHGISFTSDTTEYRRDKDSVVDYRYTIPW